MSSQYHSKVSTENMTIKIKSDLSPKSYKKVKNICKDGTMFTIQNTEKEMLLLSNNLKKDQVRLTCSLCKRSIQMASVQNHVCNVHHISLQEYQDRFGSYKNHIQQKIHHKCKVCQEVVLLDLVEIAIHLKSKDHGIMPKEYIKKFLSDPEFVSSFAKKYAKNKNKAKNTASTLSTEKIDQEDDIKSMEFLYPVKKVQVLVRKLSKVDMETHKSSIEKKASRLDLSFLDKPAPSKRKISEVILEEDETEEIHKRIKNNETVSASQLMQAIQSLLAEK